MGTAGISLTHAMMSPKSLIFLDLTERKLIAQAAIYHFEDYPGSPVTLKELNVLLAAVIWARIPQRHEDQGGFGVSHGEVARAPSAAGAPRAGAACGWQQRSAAGLGIPSAGERAWASPWDTVGNQTEARTFKS